MADPVAAEVFYKKLLDQAKMIGDAQALDQAGNKNGILEEKDLNLLMTQKLRGNNGQVLRELLSKKGEDKQNFIKQLVGAERKQMDDAMGTFSDSSPADKTLNINEAATRAVDALRSENAAAFAEAIKGITPEALNDPIQTLQYAAKHSAQPAR